VVQHGVGVVEKVALGDLRVAIVFLVLAFDFFVAVVRTSGEVGESLGSETL
jgi:hypothetical protein